jgi:acyl carrier protein
MKTITSPRSGLASRCGCRAGTASPQARSGRPGCAERLPTGLACVYKRTSSRGPRSRESSRIRVATPNPASACARGRSSRASTPNHFGAEFLARRGIAVSSTFDKVAAIIAETSEIPREEITPESHTIDDLGIDSLDFLDIVFAIDKAFGIKIPLETWTQEVNDGKASTEEYFVMKNLCAKIDALVAAKG